MNQKYTKITLPVILFSMLFFTGWGSVGHKIINKDAVASFPKTLSFLSFWSDSISSHASDADNRKSYTPDEGEKHFIDIDNYAEFNATGKISQNLDSVIALHGNDFVIEQGILPWSIKNTCDSLQAAFQRKDWQKAMLIASDLGHYVGDSNMPLHTSRNYNGQYSNQTGVHSRYESTMIGKYSSQIVYTNDSASYVSNVTDFAFNLVYGGHKYVDSVLYADSVAKALSGGSVSSPAYYQALWNLSGGFTIRLFKNASKATADLIYTAWINAGSPSMVSGVKINKYPLEKSFELGQNYPNPFNPGTMINFKIKERSKISLKIYDIKGEEIATLIDGEMQAGNYNTEFNALKNKNGNALASGVYFYQMKTNNYMETKKLVLLR
jgi:hypothetical protein